MKSRLLWLAAAITVFAWLTGGAGVLIAASIESEQSYDEQLVKVSRLILTFAQHEIEEILADGRTDMVHLETASTLDPRYAYQVWSPKGQLLLLSHSAPRKPFVPLDQVGKFDIQIDGRPFCVYALRSDDGLMLIQVAEDESARGILTPHLEAALLVFFVASTGILLLVNRWIFSRAMRALDESAQQLTDRSPQDLRPVRCDDPPSELQPLLDSLNSLFCRIQRSLESEHQFTAAAAHELRTPLAAVRMQAQVANRARSANEARVALTALIACVDRSCRMIDQLLTLARVEKIPSHAATVAAVRLDHLVRQVVEDLDPLLSENNVRVEQDLEAATLPAIEYAVAALVRNLIDNAARHAAAGGRVAVRTFQRDHKAVLTVDDAGPGIPESERARVFERFYRLAGSETDGCGVGLSIVQCVAEVHGAQLKLDSSPLGGLRVTVAFPVG